MRGRLPKLLVKGTRIVDGTGKPVRLRGVNLGGWLMMEGYMLGGRNIPEGAFREGFARALGKDALEDFTRSFRDTFIREEDIATIKSWGANCVRIPFNYRLIEFEDRPFSLNEEGLDYLNKAVGWCEKHGIYCILDLHAAPGSQNPGWHSDSNGKPDFFTNEFNIDRYLRLWHFLAELYKDSSAVAGYDVLNEAVVPFHKEGSLKDLYRRVTKEIRDADKSHIIFLEGNFWAQRLAFLGKPEDPNTVYSIHTYAPFDFTHNLKMGLVYPGKVYNVVWDKARFEMLARPYKMFADFNKVPLYMGEFGVNARDGHYGEVKWVADMVGIYNANDIHWTYWTYKTIANYAFPDGIYRYVDNPPWVNRQGPAIGLETFASLWPREKGRMTFSWRTENFVLNEKLHTVLVKGFAGKK
ncbi:MAG: glycoside hydrolase family 5 protein [Candidatus Omnitrophota bacterium]